MDTCLLMGVFPVHDLNWTIVNSECHDYASCGLAAAKPGQVVFSQLSTHVL